ncbi:cytochrome c oxidase assembly protein [Bacillus norwichensis]|uniref:Cytochrome c oxidase assembly protein n=1 Tax=Bacillus norwichensis TaxID=2762217 RepID=A0ABR8VKJ3_9BACI|nr:cytochrome c oxidase assembly protein [Bacillus norwichensis]MBD8005297.1 cytochrome c oxidase assembly protein [Bacillus norwichensis]
MNWNVFSGFTWYEMWSPITFIVIALVSVIYAKKIMHSSNYKVTKKQMAYYYTAAVLFYIVKGSPFKVAADSFAFSAHVIEVMTVLFIVLPLFILSMPPQWIRQYFWNHRLKFTIKLLGHPWMAALLFNGALTVYFAPPIFNLIQQSTVLSISSQVFLVFTGFLMWWTIIMPLPEISKFSYFTRVAYIFLNSVLLMPIGIFLLIGITEEHYTLYTAVAGEMFPSLSAVYDQQLGGGILKVIQLTSYGIALFCLIGNWSKKEDEREGQIDDENIRVVQGVVIHLPKK